MTKFLRKIILISIFPILLVLGFDFWLRDVKLTYKAKYDQLMQLKKKTDVLVLGNSHTNYGIDPTMFDKYEVFNIANVSQKIYFDKRITQKAIEDGVSNLKFVLISVDYHSLFTSSQGPRDNWSYYVNGIKYKDKDYNKVNLSPFLFGYTPKVTISFLKKKFLDKLTFLDLEIGVDPKGKFVNGFLPYMKSIESNFNEKKYKKRIKKFAEPEKSERKEVVTDLIDFVQYLKSKNITPILMDLPTYSEYNKFLDPNIIEKNNRDISNICKQEGIQFWSYMNDPRFEQKDFHDADHLNAQGAKKISKIISDRLNNL